MKKVEMATETSQPVQEQTKPVGFWEAFWFWVKLGFINFGGPAGQIAIMHRELVEKKRWVTEGQYLRTLNFACSYLDRKPSRSLPTLVGGCTVHWAVSWPAPSSSYPRSLFCGSSPISRLPTPKYPR